MRGLHGEGNANAKCGERDHRRRADADENHLAEDGPNFEELTFERGDQDPVKKAGVKPEKVLQSAARLASAERCFPD